jgi:hypothetical protein
MAMAIDRMMGWEAVRGLTGKVSARRAAVGDILTDGQEDVLYAISPRFAPAVRSRFLLAAGSVHADQATAPPMMVFRHGSVSGGSWDDNNRAGLRFRVAMPSVR